MPAAVARGAVGVTFRDRTEAGRRLGVLLAARSLVVPVVLGLARGGVPVAAEVAAALGAPLEVFVARKVGMPGREELGLGAVAEGGDAPVASEVARHLGLAPEDLEALARPAWRELERRVAIYRGGRPLPALEGRDIVLVDDGLATGVTAEAAVRALRAGAPRRVILAAPVCAQESLAHLAKIADEVVCVGAPDDFRAVGEWYEDFAQMDDDEVVAILEAAGSLRSQPAPGEP